MLKTILHSILRFFSRRIIKKYHPDIVGITGSVGKTSTKEAVSTALQARFNVRASVKNYNNEIGLPLAVIGADKSPGRSLPGWFAVFGKAVKLLIVRDKNFPGILVLEMGADKPGDIEYLTTIAPCKVGVLTAISHAHTEYFKTIKKIAQEKRVIISHLQETGYAVLNYDNDLVMENAGITKAEVVTYGFKEGADVRGSDILVVNDPETGWPVGLNFKVTYKGSTVPVLLSGIMTESYIYAALGAIAVSQVFGINLLEAAEQLRFTSSLPGHMHVIPGIKKTLIVDDTYNSSPEAVKAALSTLSKIEIKSKAERYAILGDMLELGPETENAHREIGFRVAELGIDFLITVGEASKHTAKAAREAGMDEHRIASFADSVSAGRFLQEALAEGDVVLVKGSQGVRMEKIVKEVMAEPLRAKDLLVRQDEGWEA